MIDCKIQFSISAYTLNVSIFLESELKDLLWLWADSCSTGAALEELI
jgi:hypothetical protein